MPAKTTKTSFAEKVKFNRKAFDQSKKEDVKYDGFKTLPDGIEDGVAQITFCGIKTHDKDHKQHGKPYYHVMATVIEPKIGPDGSKCEGVLISEFIPLYDTPDNNRFKTVDDHTGRLLNSIKKFGIDTADMEPDEVDGTLDQLNEDKPYFKYTTWKGKATKAYPNPQVRVSWFEILDEYTPDETDDEIEEDVEEVEEEETEETESTEDDPIVANGFLSLAQRATLEYESNEGTEGDYCTKQRDIGIMVQVDVDQFSTWEESEAKILDELAERVSGTDEDHAKECEDALVLMCGYVGLDPEAVDDEGEALYPTWTEVTEELKRHTAGEGSSSEPPEDSETEAGEDGGQPEKGDVYLYQPKGKKEPIECEVTAVNEKAETCSLKGLTDAKPYYKVAWGKLVEPEGD